MITYKKLIDMRPDRKSCDPDMIRIYDVSFDCLRGGYRDISITSLLRKIHVSVGRDPIIGLFYALAANSTLSADHADRATYFICIYSIMLRYIMDLTTALKIIRLTSSSVLGYSYADTNPLYGFRFLK